MYVAHLQLAHNCAQLCAVESEHWLISNPRVRAAQDRTFPTSHRLHCRCLARTPPSPATSKQTSEHGNLVRLQLLTKLQEISQSHLCSAKDPEASQWRCISSSTTGSSMTRLWQALSSCMVSPDSKHRHVKLSNNPILVTKYVLLQPCRSRCRSSCVCVNSQAK